MSLLFSSGKKKAIVLWFPILKSETHDFKVRIGGHIIKLAINKSYNQSHVPNGHGIIILF